MPIIKDQRYQGFKSIEGFDPIEKEEFSKMLDLVKHRNPRAARALLIVLYYSGCRPIEALRLTRLSFRKQDRKLWIVFPEAKEGDRGSLMFPLTNLHIKELADYALQGWVPGYPIFRVFQGNARRIVKSVDKKTGEISINSYVEITRPVHYFIKKVTGTIPYFFRHNRFSRAAMKGAGLREIKELKRAKRDESCYSYLHFSKAHKKKLMRYLND